MPFCCNESVFHIIILKTNFINLKLQGLTDHKEYPCSCFLYFLRLMTSSKVNCIAFYPHLKSNIERKTTSHMFLKTLCSFCTNVVCFHFSSPKTKDYQLLSYAQTCSKRKGTTQAKKQKCTIQILLLLHKKMKNLQVQQNRKQIFL